jgi:anti-anti-sigma regulatory factor
VLTVAGDEDQVTSGRRRPALSAALKAKRDVEVDLSGLRFADPSVMLDLAVLAQRLRLEGRRLRLKGAQAQILALIELVGLDRQPAVVIEPGGPAPGGGQPVDPAPGGDQPVDPASGGDQPADPASGGDQPADSAPGGDQPAAPGGDQPAAPGGVQPAAPLASAGA